MIAVQESLTRTMVMVTFAVLSVDGNSDGDDTATDSRTDNDTANGTYSGTDCDRR